MGTTDIYRALWRHRFFIVVLTAVLGAAAWYYTSRQTPIYQASSLVRVQQRVTDLGEVFTSLAVSERLAQTYAQILTTGPVYDRVYELLGDQIPPEERDISLAASPIRDLELLWISAKSADPEHAALAANAAPVALRRFIRETATLRDQIVTVAPAGVPSEPISPDLTLNLTVALLLGLIFNSALALLMERLSDRLPDPDELEALVGRPILVSIPVLSFVRSQSKPEEDVGVVLLDTGPAAAAQSGQRQQARRTELG